MDSKRYLQYFGLDLFQRAPSRTKEIFNVNPTIIPVREEAEKVRIFAYDYSSDSCSSKELSDIEEAYAYKENGHVTWLNIDGIRKSDIDAIGEVYGIHPLLREDILSVGQRPKVDDVEGVIFCLLNMLYYNENTFNVESEQISIVLGKDFVISFQEDASRDVFNPIREKLKYHQSKVRMRGADYLCYTMLDLIVDNYFVVMERLGDRIELLEEEVIRSTSRRTLAKILVLKKELLALKKNIAPVRELISGLLKSESDLLDDNTTKYFKDVYDHIIQAYELTENYRDMMMSMQDLYINNINLRMNEVMKVMAVVTCLMAPATVIGGIFGMNFDHIPELHNKYGFYVAVGLMVVIPIWMLGIFKKRGWFKI
ncbi:magnesium/cobalt transporter CorA [Pinibacter soli]|uniref:Magnesium transport protein CorA n=1 Tax=Pinibacter soli TaxID=3044211 RepID=A0ABT6RCL8_9BACT|nr:magnesium/cobalt transporter CorA [Pinibacter soli]MDI3320136.1 magnesium/cobalt transporter CorA [Pinibacter soli]